MSNAICLTFQFHILLHFTLLQWLQAQKEMLFTEDLSEHAKSSNIKITAYRVMENVSDCLRNKQHLIAHRSESDYLKEIKGISTANCNIMFALNANKAPGFYQCFLCAQPFIFVAWVKASSSRWQEIYSISNGTHLCAITIKSLLCVLSECSIIKNRLGTTKALND